MSQQFDHFTPETVDEQIERLAQPGVEKQEMLDQELVHQMQRFYQIQLNEKNNSSLEHAWKRITHSEAYLTRYAHTQPEQAKKLERRPRIMKTQPEATPDMPYDYLGRTTSPPTRIRRISRFMQTFAAILLVSILIGSFLILFASHHAVTGGPGVASQTHSIIVASTTGGTLYAMKPDNGTILWQYATGTSLGGSTPGESNIIVQGKEVYYVGGNQVYALSALNGTRLWEKNLSPPIGSYSMLQVDNGIVYISEEVGGGGSTGYMYALQASNGAVLWHHQEESESLLTAANGIAYVYVSNADGNEMVKALRGKNGQLLWQYETNATTGVALQDTLYVYSSHRLAPGDNGGNKQYKSLLALNTRTGKLRWSKPVIDVAVNPLVIVKNMVIVGSFPTLNSYRYCAYHTSNGSQVWCSANATVPAAGNVTNYIAIGDALYTITQPSISGCQVEARNISNGSLRWSHPCDKSVGNSSIVGLNGTVFITGIGNGVIGTLDSHGNIKKELQLGTSDFIISLAAGTW